jgi:hypothetical protein
MTWLVVILLLIFLLPVAVGFKHGLARRLRRDKDGK